MLKRDGLSLLVFVAALVLTTWAVRSPAAASEAPPAPQPRCSQALATRNGIAPARRASEPVPARAEAHCASALRPRAA